VIVETAPRLSSESSRSSFLCCVPQQVEKQGKGCALIERKVIDFGELIDINGWELTVAKGIDPILMIALISTKDAIKDK